MQKTSTGQRNPLNYDKLDIQLVQLIPKSSLEFTVSRAFDAAQRQFESPLNFVGLPNSEC